MKINPSSEIQSLILAGALSIASGFVSPVSAQVPAHSYILDTHSQELTELGTLGGDFSEAHGINDAGQVVG